MSTPETEPQDYSWAGRAAKHYDRQVGRLAHDLRELAERVEREGKARVGTVGTRDEFPEYVDAAHRVVHEVTWGLANGGLGNLIVAASDADRATRHPEGSL